MFRRCILAAVLVLCGTTAIAQPPALPKTFEPPQVEAFVEQAVKSKGCVGLSVAVLRDGEVILAKGFGQTAIRDGKPIASDSAFAIGSVTKQSASACGFLLAVQGMLSIHDPVAKD